MPLVYISEDEWYPVRTVQIIEKGSQRQYHDEGQVSQETLNRWASVFHEFDKVQCEIAQLQRHNEYLNDLPLKWWSVVVRIIDHNYTRHGFYGNEIEAELEAFLIEKEYRYYGYKVDLYPASNKHAKEYQHELEKEKAYNLIQEELSK